MKGLDVDLEEAVVVFVDELDELSAGGLEVEAVLDEDLFEIVLRLGCPLELGLGSVASYLCLELRLALRICS